MNEEIIGYVTIPFSDNYILTNYLTTSKEKLKWDELADRDKEAILNCAFLDIESFNFLGKKKDFKQITAFPRVKGKKIISNIENVKKAQVEQGVYHLNLLLDNRLNLINQGVSSFSIGDVRESYFENARKDKNRLCFKALKHLIGWVGGGYYVNWLLKWKSCL